MSANEWNTQTEVTNELANVTSYNIPHSVLVLEQWSDEATFYVWHGATYTAKAGSARAGLHRPDVPVRRRVERPQGHGRPPPTARTSRSSSGRSRC